MPMSVKPGPQRILHCSLFNSHLSLREPPHLSQNILKLDESCTSNPKFRNSELGTSHLTVQFTISDFGFEVQDSSNFKIYSTVRIGLLTHMFSPSARRGIVCGSVLS